MAQQIRAERRDVLRYVVGTVVSAGLTAVAFAAVFLAPDRATALWAIGVAAVAQLAVQLRVFLHLGWRGQKREDLQLVLFTLLLLAIMVGGTVWILGNLAGRMG